MCVAITAATDFRLTTSITELSFRCVCTCGRSGKDSPIGSDIKMGSCVFQCGVPHQWIVQQQVGPVSVYTVTGWGVMSCVCGMAFCVAAHWSKYHCYEQAPSRYDLRCLQATLNPNKQRKPT